MNAAELFLLCNYVCMYDYNYDYAITMTSHCEVLTDEMLGDCSQNHQSAKINLVPTKIFGNTVCCAVMQ